MLQKALEGSLHMMTHEDWVWSMRESVDWLSRFTSVS
jgi:hypothetical protein